MVHSYRDLNNLHIEFLIRDSSSASTGASKSRACARTQPASGFPIVIAVVTSRETGGAFRPCTLSLLCAFHFLDFIIQFSLHEGKHAGSTATNKVTLSRVCNIFPLIFSFSQVEVVDFTLPSALLSLLASSSALPRPGFCRHPNHTWQTLPRFRHLHDHAWE